MRCTNATYYCVGSIILPIIELLLLMQSQVYSIIVLPKTEGKNHSLYGDHHII